MNYHFRTPPMKTSRTRLLFILVLGLALEVVAVRVVAAVPSFFHANFDPEDGWSNGPVHSTGLVRVVQGAAQILETTPGEQALELLPSAPFSAIMVEGTVFGKATNAFCELLVKPPALDEKIDEEFLDFGGAAVGFFKMGKEGELRVLHGRSEEESVWLSTGVRFPLNSDGSAADWLRVTIHLNLKTDRWDLRVNGEAVLSGLRTNSHPDEHLVLWLYGHATYPVLIDDILLTTVEPDHLHQLASKDQQRAGARHSTMGQKLVTKSKLNDSLRRGHNALAAAQRESKSPVLRRIGVALESGGSRFDVNAEPAEIEGMKMRVGFFQPCYDASGNPLQGKLTITADAVLVPGADLSKMRWLVGEVVKLPNLVDVIAVGDFETGLVQVIDVPANSMKKALLTRAWVSPSEDDPGWERLRKKGRER